MNVRSSQHERTHDLVREGLIILPIVVLIGLSVVSLIRNSLYRNGLSIWEDAESKSPRKPRIYMNMGLVYDSRGMNEKAREYYQLSWKYSPRYFMKAEDAQEQPSPVTRAADLEMQAKAHHDQGVAFASRGVFDQAIDQYLAAIRLKPDYAETYNNLGNAYDAMGLAEKAIEQYQTALRLKPGYAEAHYNLGLVFERRGELKKARTEYERTLKARPDLWQARERLEAMPANGTR